MYTACLLILKAYKIIPHIDMAIQENEKQINKIWKKIMSQSQLNEYLKEKWKEMKLMGISQICIISSNLTPEIQILISYTCNLLCNTWVSNRNLKYNMYKTELLIPPSRMCNSYSVSHHTTGDHHSRSCSYQKPWQHT